MAVARKSNAFSLGDACKATFTEDVMAEFYPEAGGDLLLDEHVEKGKSKQKEAYTQQPEAEIHVIRRCE